MKYIIPSMSGGKAVTAGLWSTKVYYIQTMKATKMKC